MWRASAVSTRKGASMSDSSKIEWTDASWNPIRARNLKTGKVGWHCEHDTTGCKFCYAEGFNMRLGTGLPFKPGHRKDLEIFLDEKMLLAPLRWKKPRRVFVCSMTDAFASFVKDEWLDKMLAVMALSPQHTFQVLTKRAERMREYFAKPFRANWSSVVTKFLAEGYFKKNDWTPAKATAAIWECPALPNVWLGVSTERQQEADERIPLLLQTPAAVRFISAEPLLGPIDLKRWMPSGTWGSFKGAPVYHQTYFMTKCEHCGWLGSSELVDLCSYGDDADCVCPACHKIFMCDDFGDGRGLRWIIAGGESGRGARPMHPAWARSLREQCAAANVRFFFKQFGAWAPYTPVAGGDLGREVKTGRVQVVHPTGQSDLEVFTATGGRNTIPGTIYMKRVGKKKSGRLLDGKEHNEFPELAT